TCWATEYRGNTASATFTITVRDTTAPTLFVPSNMIVRAKVKANPREGTVAGAYVNFSIRAFDIVDGWAVPTAMPASGSFFPIGTTTVTITRTDAHNNTATRTFTITVKK